MISSVMKSKFLWSTSDQSTDRRHTFKDRTENSKNNPSFQKSKRCLSMPSVSSASSSASLVSKGNRSRMLRLQDRRFHQRFSKVHPDEHLLNYFSCALLQDRLLHQGHLFITDNNFAFYSNIFGHKKEILIPISDVVKVTKEKTAKFIPNAVGVYTDKEKYIFGSLLSRDTTFRVIQQTWIRSTDAGLDLPEDSENEFSPVLVLMCPGEEDSSVSSGVSGHLSDEVSNGVSSSDGYPMVEANATTSDTSTNGTTTPHQATPTSKALHYESIVLKSCLSKVNDVVDTIYQLPRLTLLYVISLALIILLLMSAAVLFYRISLVNQRLPGNEKWRIHSPSSARYNNAEPVIETDEDIEMMIQRVQERVKHISLIRHAIDELLITTSELYLMRKSTD